MVETYLVAGYAHQGAARHRHLAAKFAASAELTAFCAEQLKVGELCATKPLSSDLLLGDLKER
jgi:hypothetical protein